MRDFKAIVFVPTLFLGEAYRQYQRSLSCKGVAQMVTI